MPGRCRKPQTPIASTCEVTLVADELKVLPLGKLAKASSQQDRPTTPVLTQSEHVKRSRDKARSRSRRPRTPREHKLPEEHGLPDTARLLGKADDSDAIMATADGKDNFFEDLPLPEKNFPSQDIFFDLPPPEKKPGKVVELPVILWQRSPTKQQALQPDLTSSSHLSPTKQHLKEIAPRTPTQVDQTDAPRLHMPAVVRETFAERNRNLEAPRGSRSDDDCSGTHCQSETEDCADMRVAQSWRLGDEDLLEGNAIFRTPEENRQINECSESITFVHEPQEHGKTHHLESDFIIGQDGDETIAKVFKAEHMDALSDLSTDDNSQQRQILGHAVDAGSSIPFHLPAEAYPANVSSLVRSAVSGKNTSIVVETGAVRPSPHGMNSARSQRLLVDPPQKPSLEREITDSTSLNTWSASSVSSKATCDSSSSGSSLRSNSAKVPDAFARRYDRDGKMLYLYVGIASCCILMLIGAVLGVALATVHGDSESRANTEKPMDGHSRLRRLYSRWSQFTMPSGRFFYVLDIAPALLLGVFFSCCLSIGIVRLLSMGSYHKCDGACGRNAAYVATGASLMTWTHLGISLNYLDRDGPGIIHSNCCSSSDTV